MVILSFFLLYLRNFLADPNSLKEIAEHPNLAIFLDSGAGRARDRGSTEERRQQSETGTLYPNHEKNCSPPGAPKPSKFFVLPVARKPYAQYSLEHLRRPNLTPRMV